MGDVSGCDMSLSATWEGSLRGTVGSRVKVSLGMMMSGSLNDQKRVLGVRLLSY